MKPFSSEPRSIRNHSVFFLEQVVARSHRKSSFFLQTSTHIGKRIKRAFRLAALEPGNLAQRFSSHARRAVYSASMCRLTPVVQSTPQPRPIARSNCVRRRVALDFQHRFGPLSRRECISHAPTRHRISFRKRSRDAQTRSQLGRQTRGAEHLARRINKTQVTFVGNDVDAALGWSAP